MADASGRTTMSVWMFERRITRVRYLVQAILIDGDIETVVGSIKSEIEEVLKEVL